VSWTAPSVVVEVQIDALVEESLESVGPSMIPRAR
jgi:hypothetical protein